MTDPLGQSQVLPYLTGLVKRGYKFWILSCEKEKAFAENASQIQAQVDTAGITWVPLRYHALPPVLSTLIDVKALCKKSKEIIRDHNIQIVHCRSYIAALAGLSAKKKLGTKFVFDMRGFWADERVEGAIWNISNPVYRMVYNYFKQKEIEYFSLADYTISLTENGRDEIWRWDTITNNPIAIKVIPCCADLDLFSPRAKNKELLEAFDIKDSDFVISYLGSVGTWYMLGEMLQFFRHLLAYKPNSYFLFITGDDPDTIKGKAQELGIDISRIIIRKADRQDVPHYLSVCDLSVFFIKQSFSKKASSPTKMGEIMGMGIPIICNDNVGDVGTIMAHVNKHAVLSDFSEKSFRNALDFLDQILGEDRTKIRDTAKKYYSLQTGISRYQEVYDALL